MESLVMKRITMFAAAAALVTAGITGAGIPGLQGTEARAQQPSTGGHRASRYYRSGGKVRGSRARRGGYSYSAEDTINTYGDSRTMSGGANSYRFELYTRQTTSGPFDHGFFFDSGIGLHGGDSPYMN
jgi:hypothetical protein